MLVSWRVAGSSGCLVARVGCRRGRPAALRRATQAAHRLRAFGCLYSTGRLRYICNPHKMRLSGTGCQRLPVDPIDTGVVQNFWEALSPAALDCYDEAVAAFDEQHRQVERAHHLQLERFRYEARLAEKQYRLVDAENRLVAAELERRWEQALQALRQGEEEAASSRRLSPSHSPPNCGANGMRPVPLCVNCGTKGTDQRPQEGVASGIDRQCGLAATRRGHVRRPHHLERGRLDHHRTPPASGHLRQHGQRWP